MQSRTMRIVVLAVVIAAAIAALIALASSNSGKSEEVSHGVQTVRVDPSGNPVGGVKTLTYNRGDRIELHVVLAAPEQAVHVHGYEYEKPAEHSPVVFSFPARLDGVFEVEVHRLDKSEGPIAELHVNP